MVHPESSCRLCESTSKRLLFKKKGYSTVQCTNCAFVYLSVTPDKAFLDNLYSQSYFKGEDDSGYGDYLLEKEQVEKTASKRLNQINSFTQNGKTLLEIGAAYGFFLNVAKELYTVTGVELSTHASQYASDCLGLNVINGTIHESNFESSQFDLVTMWDVIEHLADPMLVMKEVNRIMSSSGLLTLTTPDAGSVLAKLQGKSWRLYDPPYHLCYFSHKTIRCLLEASGFTVARIKYSWETHTLRYIFHALCDYYDNKLLRVLKAITQKTIIGSIPIYLTTFDVMTVYAFKSREV